MSALAASTLLASRPKHAASQRDRGHQREQQAGGGEPVQRVGDGRKPAISATPMHERGRDDVARDARGDVAGEHGAGGDRQRAEAVDHAGGHVERDGDGGAGRAEARAQHDDPGHDVVDVAAARCRSRRRRRRRTSAGSRPGSMIAVSSASMLRTLWRRLRPTKVQRMAVIGSARGRRRRGRRWSSSAARCPACEGAAHVLGAVADAQAHVVRDPSTALRAASVPSAKKISSVSAATRCLSSCAVPCATIAAVVDHRDPVGEPVGLLEVLGGEQDRSRRRRRASARPPTPRGGCAGPGPVVGSSRKSTSGLDHEAHRQVQPAPHAAAVGGDAAVGGVGQVEALEQLVGATRCR